MAYTVPSVVASGQVITAAHLNSVRTALTELQGEVDQDMTTWASPFASGVTVGNGAIAAKYCQVSNLVLCNLHFLLGSTSAIAGPIVATLPVTAQTANSTWGMVRCSDASPVQDFYGIVIGALTTTAAVALASTSGTYLSASNITSTVPFTWTTSDSLFVNLVYLAAA